MQSVVPKAVARARTVASSIGFRLESRRRGTHQVSHATWEDRYPEVFESVSVLLGKRDDLRILSFGCSTGEEVRTLARLFPGAEIVGADISERTLRKASAACRDLPQCSFVNPSRTSLGSLGPFDVAFAMSVLCKHPQTELSEDISAIYPFREFESSCDELASLLKSMGLLVIYNSNYRFTDTPVSRSFARIESIAIPDSGFVVKFDPDGRRSTGETYTACVFQKLSG